MTLKRLNPGSRMSQAVCIGNIAFLAGQVPDDLDADISEQTRQVLGKMDQVVKELGATKADIASVQVWLSDMEDFQGMNAVWDEWVSRDAPPARATGGVALARPGMRVEMIAVVALPVVG
ncbi:RidA family protein [Sedimentitalea nanhaiensis]|uniref:Enamine deaminase RidA, house cleaning of reactive enamine intermediates, YjgF/YER057c/UK114 family n=1 Tax=Sedimentitalea nanhaiensis TaxID=999627 RepID=A0A1I7DWC0_9RHOB|nr:RidA family protein [Sedimentitalea nanhaiensis]SFU15954.1 Enamine deaminase RidA, house cleaning of reactive enamine intermediates, YjgF/YER057c/UK114 family [Sedimentitalea nanhaiensis]